MIYGLMEMHYDIDLYPGLFRYDVDNQKRKGLSYSYVYLGAAV